MPTAARLAAAVCYALVAFFASEAFEPLLPDGTQTAGFSEINALFGAFAGWRGNGREVGLGYARAVTTSLITVATLVFYALVFHSVYQMIELAMRLYQTFVEDEDGRGRDFSAMLPRFSARGRG